MIRIRLGRRAGVMRITAAKEEREEREERECVMVKEEGDMKSSVMRGEKLFDMGGREGRYGGQKM